MKKARMDLEKKKPGVEINKPPGDGPWQRPNAQLALYLLMFALMWFWWQSDLRVAQEEIPYSQFLKYLEQDQVDIRLADLPDCIITVISGERMITIFLENSFQVFADKCFIIHDKNTFHVEPRWFLRE